MINIKFLVYNLAYRLNLQRLINIMHYYVFPEIDIIDMIKVLIYILD